MRAAILVLTLGSVLVSAQSAKSYRARLSPVALDVAMQATVSGSGAVTAVLSGTKLTVTGTFDGLKSPATIAQIHKSPIAGVRGPVVADLSVSAGSGGTSGTINGTLTVTPQQATDLEKKRLYVQLHSEKAPDGNLWGWLMPVEGKR
ncbi:MAG TPA: CHRD domain-containing protein [Vicinamibacterales bacterium]|nr:CHRD domain-containing protein [Vicinamibacterales bacterium]